MNVYHESAAAHVSGQAEYIDDRTPIINEVFVDVVYSQVAHGTIRSIDTSEALKSDGVLAVFLFPRVVRRLGLQMGSLLFIIEEL